MSAISYADGTSLVPTPVANEIIKEVGQVSAAMKLFKKVNMSSKTHKTPVQSAVAEAAWVAEGGTKTTTEVTWGDQTITAEELAVIVPVSDNLLADSAFDVWAEVKNSLVSAFARKIDAAVLFGTDAPASFPDSVAESAIAAGNTVDVGTNAAGAGGLVQDVIDAMALVGADGYPVTGFVASDLFDYQLLGARGTDGQPLIQNNGSITTLLGRPIAYVGQNVFGSGVSDVQLIAGDFTKAVIGVRQDITFTLSNSAVVGGVSMFETDQTAIRAVMRVGYTLFRPIHAGNSGNATRSPFAVVANPAT
jgi:HK97 family phage major capsid protein